MSHSHLDENNPSKETYVRLKIEEKDVKPFLDYFSSMSNTEWINIIMDKEINVFFKMTSNLCTAIDNFRHQNLFK